MVSKIKIYLNHQPYKIVRVADTTTGDVTDIVKIQKEIPEDWSAIVGDIVHNLRTALDYLVTALVIANGNSPSRSNSFPIDNSLEDYENNSPDKLTGLNQNSIEFINGLKPYKDGNDVLWRLHKLDIQDKHRTNLIVGAAYRSVNLTFKMDFLIKRSSFQLYLLNQQIGCFPLKDGEALFKLNKSTADPHKPEDNSYTFEVDFSGDEIINGREITNTMLELIQYIEKVLDDASKL